MFHDVAAASKKKKNWDLCFSVIIARHIHQQRLNGYKIISGWKIIFSARNLLL